MMFFRQFMFVGEMRSSSGAAGGFDGLKSTGWKMTCDFSLLRHILSLY